MLLSVMFSLLFVGEEDDFTILITEIKFKHKNPKTPPKTDAIKLISRTRYSPVLSHYTK